MSNPEQQKKWREMKRAYRNRHKAVCVSFTQERGKELQEMATLHKLPLADFVKALVEAHIKGNGYVVPDHGHIDRLSFLLRNVATNINQLVRYAHIEQGVNFSDIQKLQQQLAIMESHIKHTLSIPPHIETVLTEFLNQYPTKREKLIQFLIAFEP